MPWQAGQLPPESFISGYRIKAGLIGHGIDDVFATAGAPVVEEAVDDGAPDVSLRVVAPPDEPPADADVFERILDQVLGQQRIAGQHKGEAQQRAMALLDEHVERRR